MARNVDALFVPFAHDQIYSLHRFTKRLYLSVYMWIYVCISIYIKHDVSLYFLKSRIIAVPANVFCWLYPTMDKVYLILSWIHNSHDYLDCFMVPTVSHSPSSACTYIPRLPHGSDCFTVSSFCAYTHLGSRGHFGILMLLLSLKCFINNKHQGNSLSMLDHWL